MRLNCYRVTETVRRISIPMARDLRLPHEFRLPEFTPEPMPPSHLFDGSDESLAYHRMRQRMDRNQVLNDLTDQGMPIESFLQKVGQMLEDDPDLLSHLTGRAAVRAKALRFRNLL
jgi:hypothetical protein